MKRITRVLNQASSIYRHSAVIGNHLDLSSRPDKLEFTLLRGHNSNKYLFRKYSQNSHIDLDAIKVLGNRMLDSEQAQIILRYDEKLLLDIQEIRINGNIEKITMPNIAKESRKNFKDTKLAILNILAAMGSCNVEDLSTKIKFEVFGQTGSYQSDSKFSFEIPLYTIEDNYDSSNEGNEGLDQFDMIVDVRSPLEFSSDHLPNAINLPVLNDEQRDDVGRIYFNVPSSARGIGASIITRNISKIIHSHFLNISRDTKILVYCWRGGLRSKSLAIILNQMGFHNVILLSGGYKNFRKQVRDTLPHLIKKHRYVVLAGRTGTGKTLLLNCLKEKGENVIDLEEVAKHKGSVLGAYAAHEQPSQKLFDTYLWNILRKMKPGGPIWIEKEGKKIGNLLVPKELIDLINSSPRIHLNVDLERRVEFLLNDYKWFLENPIVLIVALEHLIKHSGKKTVEMWKEMVEEEKYYELVTSLLTDYYDRLYDSKDTKDATMSSVKISKYQLPSDLSLDKTIILDSSVINDLIKLKSEFSTTS